MVELGERLIGLAEGVRFAWNLPRLWRAHVGVEQAEARLHELLGSRCENFLTQVHDAVYAHPESPYFELLSLAGCEYGDVERLVRTDGLEAALRALLRAGVYL